MNHVRRIALFGGMTAALLASAATPAFATLPPGSPKHPTVPPRALYEVHTATVGGTPGWQIILIALAAAAVAATAAVLLERARMARRKPATAST